MHSMEINQVSHEYHDIEAAVIEAFRGRSIHNDTEVRSRSILRTELGLGENIIRDVCTDLLQRYNVSSLTQTQLEQMQSPRLIALYIHGKLVSGSEERHHTGMTMWPNFGLMTRVA